MAPYQRIPGRGVPLGRFLVAGLVTIAVLEGCTVVAGIGEPRANANDAISARGSTRDAGGGDASGRKDAGPISTGASGRLWMLNGPGNEAQAMATDPNGIAFFGQASVETLYPVDHHVAPPASWHVSYFKRYTSYAQFEGDVGTEGAISGDVHIVVYDNEAWSQTPSAEQADPITYAQRFAELAHQHGYAFMNTPAEDLMQARFPGQNKYLKFLDYGYAAAVAPNCEYYEIQSQQVEMDTSGNATNPSFDWFTKQVAAQARGANPKVVVLAGLVAKAGYSSTDIVNAVHATSDDVSGYWLNILCELDCTAGDGLENTKTASIALTTLMTEQGL
jgi:hypothetical protein